MISIFNTFSFSLWDLEIIYEIFKSLRLFHFPFLIQVAFESLLSDLSSVFLSFNFFSYSICCFLISCLLDFFKKFSRHSNPFFCHSFLLARRNKNRRLRDWNCFMRKWTDRILLNAFLVSKSKGIKGETRRKNSESNKY